MLQHKFNQEPSSCVQSSRSMKCSTLRYCASLLFNRNTFSHIPMKSSPYVGWFRHSPPAGEVTRLAYHKTEMTPINKKLSIRCSCFLQEKGSPYVGWFRHSPPSCLYFKNNPIVSEEFLATLKKISIVCASSNDTKFQSIMNCHDSDTSKKNYQIGGPLPGGNPIDDECSHSSQDNFENSNERHPSATLELLSKLAALFLSPLVPATNTKNDYSQTLKNIQTIIIPIMRRFLMLENDVAKMNLQQNLTCLSSSIDSQHSIDDNSYDQSETSQESNSNNSRLSNDSILENLHSTSIANDQLSISVLSLAEAYCAERTCEEILNQISSPPMSISIMNSLDSSVHHSQANELDYVITQMDIARMAKNASRHLDVGSILTLPTIIFQSDDPPSYIDIVPTHNLKPFRNQEIHSANEEELCNEESNTDLDWSWITIPSKRDTEVSLLEDDRVHVKTSKAVTTVREEQISKQQKKCVICLEEFQDGDRLRVLPCSHLFHMGCIDKWLSGSFSHKDCFTYGCPTCKKTANAKEEDAVEVSTPSLKESGSELSFQSVYASGVLPSWAFTRLGGALAKDS